MTIVRKPFSALVEIEETMAENYEEMSGKAVLSNIRYFLNLFSSTHTTFAEKLRSYAKGEKELETSEFDAPVTIWATQHLLSEEDVDLGSLQSVLLYIAKAEEESLSEFDTVISEADCTKCCEALARFREEKSILTTKADRLYHDMIESKVS